MAGARPLDEAELRAVIERIGGKHSLRDRALFALGCNTGFRISELLSLNIGDVYQHGRIVDRVTVRRRHMKGKIASRTMPLNTAAKSALLPHIALLLELHNIRAPGNIPLFSVYYRGLRRMDRKQAWAVLHAAFDAAQLDGPLGTHAMRKTFARVMYRAVGRNLERLRILLGHKWITTTQSYIAGIEAGAEEFVLSVSIGGLDIQARSR